MRAVLTAVAVLCDLTGTVWILQGIGLLPGSFMTGQAIWAAIGAVLVLVATLALVVLWRPRGTAGAP